MLPRLVDNVIDQLNVRQKPGLLLTADYCPAFDRISKDFMIQTLKTFEFGPDFVKWVSVLMAEAKSYVAYCGWLSKYFAVEAGIRQGCPPPPPPPPPLFSLFTISLCSCGRKKKKKKKKNRHCVNIKGLKGLEQLFTYLYTVIMFMIQ